MKRSIASAALLAMALMPVFVLAAWMPSTHMKTATVFVANYDSEDTFVGWGSGFFVDEGIVVTNKHVLEKGDWHRVYATNDDDTVDFDCFRAIQKSDVRVNLNDDVAYMRVYLQCEHGMLDFGDDPRPGDDIAVLGYPTKGLSSTSVRLSIATGSVMSGPEIDWMRTDAYLDIGNSGGPVVNETNVVGVAVARGEDEEGNYVTGFFIPSSVILDGLLYANDSRFGYVPRSRSSSSRQSSARSSIVSSSFMSSSRSSASSASSRVRSSAMASQSSRASVPSVFRDVRVTRRGYAAILSLYEQGVLQGYSDGTFRPNNGINRAEFIKILVAGFRDDEAKGEARCFSDVGDEWFATYVCAAKRLGWIGGYPNGTFQPAQLVNRAEAMKILINAFGMSTQAQASLPADVPASAWFAPYVATGVRIGIVNPVTLFRPGLDLTRENAAIWIDGATKR